jgi:putative SOS response-associated peptidase YedK
MRWGFVPHWSKDQNLGYRLINARAETVSKKRAFRDSLNDRRCIIPADGFYEWKHLPGGKQPYLIRLTGGSPFGFAGLWDRWAEPNGTTHRTFTILTTSANSLIRPVHPRMPVILDRSQREEWLEIGSQQSTLERLSRPYPFMEMEAFPITTFVNDVDNDSRQCLQPLDINPNPNLF